jgi:hypothetical protein
MTSAAKTIEEYLEQMTEDRRVPMQRLHQQIMKKLPKGFEAQMNYGMIGYVVPHKIYPAGYHCDPKLPLPFMGLAAQKNAISFYHMGIYSDPKLMDWFTKAYAEKVPGKLDMGKSCVRFKKPELIPYELIGELVTKMKVADWVACYEGLLKKKK